MSRLMILGAGVYQVPLIRKAQSLGIETLVASYPGPYPGLDIADHALLIDTTDAQKILDAARRERVDGIVTTGTDVAVRTIGVVCDALGLCGVTAHTAQVLTDKAYMKDVFIRGNVPTAPFQRVTNLEEAHIAARSLGFPVMVKACDVSGSRGVTKVTDEQGIELAFDEAMRATRTDHVVVEKFVPGREIGVDGFVVDGELVFFAPHDKFVYRAGNVTIPSGHGFPLHASEATKARIRDAIERAVRASGFITGAINSDVMVAPDGGISVLELGGRCGATCIPELITLHTGVDYYEQIIRASLGLSVDFTITHDLVPCMSKLLFSKQDGTVSAIDRKRIARIEQHYDASVTLDVTVGDFIHHVHDGTDRFGSIVMPSQDERVIDAALEELAACIRIHPLKVA